MAIYVGRVAAENLELVVRSFDVFKVQPKARMVIVGNGPRLESLKQERRFHCWSAAWMIWRITHASGDVFLFPSITETFGNVVLEAMAAGLGVVAYDYAAPRLLIRSGRTAGWRPSTRRRPF